MAKPPPILTDYAGNVARFSRVGSYPVFHILDHEAACADCVAEAIANGDADNVTACGINWEDPYLYCGCGERIESAYAEDTHGH